MPTVQLMGELTDGLLAVKPGMTYDELEAIIGPPLCVAQIEDVALDSEQQTTAADLVAGCGPLQRTASSVPLAFRTVQKLSLSYAEPRESFSDPNIYVALARGRVSSVYVKKDDLGICCVDGQANSPFYWTGSRGMLRELIGR